MKEFMGRTKTAKSNLDLKVKRILDVIHHLAIEFAKQEDGRKKLQQYTGLSKGGLNGFLYVRKGSVLTWLQVFLCIFDLSPDSAFEALQGFESVIRKKGQINPADKRWFTISSEMDDDTKHYWLSIFEYAMKLKEGKK
jgi:hypothetical protein